MQQGWRLGHSTSPSVLLFVIPFPKLRECTLLNYSTGFCKLGHKCYLHPSTPMYKNLSLKLYYCAQIYQYFVSFCSITVHLQSLCSIYELRLSWSHIIFRGDNNNFLSIVPLTPNRFAITRAFYANNDFSVVLEWDVPTGDGPQYIVDEYNLVISPGSVSHRSNRVFIPFTILILNYNVEYTATVAAINCAGVSSSNNITFKYGKLIEVKNT